MNISLNDKYINLCTIKNKPLSISEILMCLIILKKDNPDTVLNTLIAKGVVIQDLQDKNIYYVHSKYQPLIENFLLQSDKNVPEITELEDLVTKLQELFPKERKLDANGVPKYAYRGNKRDIEQRLRKFFKLYGQYSYNDVLECTKRYVESFKHDKTYMRILPYYIMKDNESQLATELENIDIEQEQRDPALNYGDKLL